MHQISIFLCGNGKNRAAEDETNFQDSDDSLNGGRCFSRYTIHSILNFCTRADSASKKNQSTIVNTHSDMESMKRSLLFIGSYMALTLGNEPEYIAQSFEELLLDNDLCVDSKYLSHTKDCWGSLRRSNELGWLGSYLNDSHLHSHWTGDFHELLPGHLVLIRAPQELAPGALWADIRGQDGEFLRRDFSPRHQAAVLKRLGTRAVVRLHCDAGAPEAHCPPDAFEAHGIPVADLHCASADSPPPAAAVAKFLRIAAAVPGPVALHGPAGPVAALAALLLMARFGFPAGQAVAWLHLVAPACWAGGHLDYLRAREAVLRRVEPELAATAAAAAGSGLGHQEAADGVGEGRDAAAAVAAAVREVESRLGVFHNLKCKRAGGGGGAAPGAAECGGGERRRRGSLPDLPDWPEPPPCGA